MDSYCLAVGSPEGLRARVRKLVAKTISHDPARFLGIADVFHAEGPLQSGCMLGHCTYLEIKTRAAARTLLAPIRLKGVEATWLCAQPVYFVEACDGDYAVTAHLLVRRSTRGLSHVKRLAKSPRFIAVLKRTAPFEPLDDAYHLLGFRGIHPIAAGPLQEVPFEELERRYRSLPTLRKELVSKRRIDSFFASRRTRQR